jgi:putative beta-lysine N-acetyltransferase
MADVIEKLRNSLIQHGKDSDRVYLMKLAPAEASRVVERIAQMAEANDYGKLFAKIPADAAAPFVQAGYIEEARIPRFYDGRIDGLFMSRFCKPQRRFISEDDRSAIDKTLQLAEAKQHDEANRPQYDARRLDERDTDALAALYRTVFPSYPFPIFDPSYLKQTMRTHIAYYGIAGTDGLVAASSAEMDREAGAVEMTDFATDPAHRGKGLAVSLLERMEADMSELGIATAYTIASAISVGMNITFGRCGYHFAGTLINNTQISGRIESMNVWYKHLSPPA